MKIKCYRVNPDIELEIEGANDKELFEAMAHATEVFGSHWQRCQACKSNFKPIPVVREVDGNRFYELHCTNPACRARFAFGQSKDMKTLYPQRKYPKSHPRAGEYKDNNGWDIWEKKEEESPPPSPPSKGKR